MNGNGAGVRTCAVLNIADCVAGTFLIGICPFGVVDVGIDTCHVHTDLLHFTPDIAPLGLGGDCFLPDGVQNRCYGTVLGAGQRTCLPRLIRSGAVLFKAPPLEGVALAGGNVFWDRECVACFACRVCSMGLRGGRTGAAVGVVVQGKVPFCTHAVITHLVATAEFHGIPRLPVFYTENPCAVGCLNARPDLFREGNAELGKSGFGLEYADINKNLIGAAIQRDNFVAVDRIAHFYLKTGWLSVDGVRNQHNIAVEGIICTDTVG